MEVSPINLTELVAVMMGCSIVLIPVLAVSLRFALRPIVEAIWKHRKEDAAEQLRAFERRLALLEQTSLPPLSTGREFDSLRTS